MGHIFFSLNFYSLFNLISHIFSFAFNFQFDFISWEDTTSDDPFVQLDRLDDLLWNLEKSGALNIPGPKLPTFNDEEFNPITTTSSNASGIASGIEMKKNNDSPVGNKRQSSQARAASNNGMSMDNHASVTMASEFRRQISESESHT
tara:strand:+ start:1778 stop:2218 length:441 start_codon:yes stop_codon:yes gene_type:complete